MHTRIQLDPGSATVPCERCGQPTLHVARLVRKDGTPVCPTMVCTTCTPRRTEPIVPTPRPAA